MKKIVSASILTLILSSCGQTETSIPTTTSTTEPDKIAVDNKTVDSVTVESGFLANSPFSDVSELDYFNKLMSKSTKTSVKTEKSIHDNTLTNTIKTIEFGQSVIETLTTSSGKTLLRYASVDDSNFELKNKIKLGVPADKVFSTFNVNYDSNKSYKFLQLNSPDSLGGGSSLTFYFTKDTLTRIFYWPYLD